MSRSDHPRQDQPKRTQGSAPADRRQNALRALPSIDEVVRAVLHREQTVENGPPRDAVTRAAREAVVEARAAILDGGAERSTASIVERACVLLAVERRPSPRPVINATGVVINTNLGRSPLSQAAVSAMVAVAQAYSNLEYDLEAGERGSRQTHVRHLLRLLTGAEDALVVNNNAAAVLVTLATLASGREVIVSRGELVEIGGGFRVPDVMLQSGARLVEVGTTNRTRVADYEAAITPETALLLSVHPSNFRVVGFTEAPDIGELAACAHARGLPLVHDLGSGCLLRTERWGMAHEPTPQESLAAGADVVCFSGDKLLGGPQAGLIVGRVALLRQIGRHPLMRATRIDKLTLAALEATLREYRDGTAEREIPIWRAIGMSVDDIRARAERWVRALDDWGVVARVVPGESTVGGGSLPGETLPTALCAIDGMSLAAAQRSRLHGVFSNVDGKEAAQIDASGDDPLRRLLDIEALAARLRRGDPSVVARVYRDQLLLDPRTVLPGEDDLLLSALRHALERR